MAELLLTIEDVSKNNGNYISWRPTGTVQCALSSRQIRNKWLEIICSFPDPKRKHDPKHETIPGWTAIVSAWTPKLRAAWFDARHSGVLQSPTLLDDFWTEQIEPLDLLANLGKEPVGIANIYDTWLWSDYERKRFFIQPVTEPDADIIEAMQGYFAADATGHEIDDPKAQPTYFLPHRVLDWRTEIVELNEATKIEIANKGTIVQPRFDKAVDVTLPHAAMLPEEVIR